MKLFNEENTNEEVVVGETTTTEEVVETNEEVAVEATETPKEEVKNVPHTSAPIDESLLPDNFNPFARPVNPRFANRGEKDFEERVIQIKRVIKVTKGGRRFKFSALVVVGDRKGRVGYAVGKHIEVPEAIKKAVRQAKKNIVNVKVVGESDTIPHEAIGHKGSARVLLKPASEGKGIIASDVVRAVVELAGYRNIYSKNMGTNNPQNVLMGTLDALLQMRTATEFASLKKEIVRKAPAHKPADKKSVKESKED